MKEYYCNRCNEEVNEEGRTMHLVFHELPLIKDKPHILSFRRYPFWIILMAILSLLLWLSS